MARFKKAFGALLGAVTAGAVIAVAHALGVDLDLAAATAVAGVLAAVGAALAPKNAE